MFSLIFLPAIVFVSVISKKVARHLCRTCTGPCLETLTSAGACLFSLSSSSRLLSSTAYQRLYTVKKVSDFPIPSRDVTYQTLSGGEYFNYSRPRRVWLVTSRLGTGKTLTFFYSVLLTCEVNKVLRYSTGAFQNVTQ
jgi:hypothetical protein